MSHGIKSTEAIERWDQGSNRVLSRRYAFSAHIQDHILGKTGCLVHIILMAIVCETAAHKVGGFRSHSHTNFYTLF
jgi:hypothetical protein